MTVRTTHKEL